MSQTYVSRPRIGAMLEAAAARRVTLLCAPFGFGKTSVLRHEPLLTNAAYLSLGERTSFPRFAGDLVGAMSAHLPGMRLTLAGAFERAVQRSDPADALAVWFSRHVKDFAGTIVIDDLQNSADPLIARFVTRAVERCAGGLRWLLSSSNLEELPVASWLAHETAGLPIEEHDLRLTLDEAFALGEQLAPHIGRETLARLQRSTDGVVTDFVFSLRTPETESAERPETIVSFEPAVAGLMDDLSQQEREVVLQTSLMPALTPVMLSRSVGAEGAATIAKLRERSPQFFDDDGLRYQGRFRAYLRTAVRALEPSLRSRIVARAGRALEASGDIAQALQLFVEVGDEQEILRLIERHGYASLENDRSYFLHDALAALGDEARDSNASVLAVRAMMASLGGRLDVSEALFQHALAACEAPQLKMRIRYLYACDVLRRGRTDAIDLLKPDAAFFEAPAEVRVAVMSLLGAAYIVAGRASLARKWVDRALAAADRLADDALSARVHHQASYVALYGGDPGAAKRLAQASATLAEKEGAYEIAGGAYSVLYAAAMELDDDPVSAAKYAERIAHCGAKCGSVEKQLYAMSAGYEIAVERGNVEVADELAHDLEEFDVQYSARAAVESILPARSLMLAGAGRFDNAFQLLRASSEGHMFVGRQALRWSEIAVYAVASGATEEAKSAVLTALKLLRESDRSSSHALRTRIFCALTLVLLGRLAGPRTMLVALRRDLPAKSQRLSALLVALEALLGRRSGECKLDAIALTLQELRRRELGGYARLIEALPSELVRPLHRVGLPAAGAA